MAVGSSYSYYYDDNRLRTKTCVDVEISSQTVSEVKPRKIRYDEESGRLVGQRYIKTYYTDGSVKQRKVKAYLHEHVREATWTTRSGQSLCGQVAELRDDKQRVYKSRVIKVYPSNVSDVDSVASASPPSMRDSSSSLPSVSKLSTSVKVRPLRSLFRILKCW